MKQVNGTHNIIWTEVKNTDFYLNIQMKTQRRKSWENISQNERKQGGEMKRQLG